MVRNFKEMNFKPVYFVKILRKKDSGVGEGRSCFAQMWVRPAAVQSVAEASVRCTQTRASWVWNTEGAGFGDGWNRKQVGAG